MSLYDDLLADIADCLFDASDADTPTECVTYRPDGDDAREIQAFVDREPAQELGNSKAGVMQLTVLNHDPLGIASSSIDVGRDKIDVSERSGVTAKTRQIYRIVSHTATHMIIEVR